MPWGLRRFQETGQLHFLTFSCYKRRPNFANAPSRTTFETSLERARQHYGLCVYGYVVMPEHIHMLVNEPERGSLSRVMQSLKQSVARTLALRAADPFWQARYYDFNVWSEHKFVEKLRYIHRNPVNARVSCPSRRLALEQLPSLCKWRGGSSRTRVAVDRAAERAGRYLSNSTEAFGGLAGPPKQSLDGAPS